MAPLQYESDSDASSVHSNDLDAPRTALWQGDDDDFQPSESEQDSSPENNIQADLSSLPLGALRKAQRTLGRQQVNASEESDSSDDEEDESDSHSVPPVINQKPNSNKGKAPAHRKNKHAPMEVTSKRPVSRRRTVVEVQQSVPRDPRFLPVAGDFSAEHFRNSYDFLSEGRKSELSQLRQDLKRAKRRLSSVPKQERPQHQAEMSRLELALKRAESSVNQDRRFAVEQKAMSGAREAEKVKRKDGKANWWMKNSEKKAFLEKARYDALAAEGGRRAVKKAMDKKQKKEGQKEKKSRPFAKVPPKRQAESGGGPSSKRRKIG